ncbi:hypothetical protein SESBI_26356 [Sesbania bispinosa]|nr:hypothetical protein SESBI_26356 [Sesbania bispinosa]
MEEVQANTSQATECNATEPRRNIRIVVVGNELEKIDELSRLMSKEDRDAFNKRYGRILDLLSIKVKTKSLSALAQFWNTNLRCFELPNFDIVPTIEEYGLMYEENGANPIPAILADTFLSMMVCRQKKGGSLRCRSHMSYVWIMTHLYARHPLIL